MKFYCLLYGRMKGENSFFYIQLKTDEQKFPIKVLENVEFTFISQKTSRS